MSDPVGYLQAMDAAACRDCTSRARLEAEVQKLRAEVREWLCTDCNTVYPGPPASGLAGVKCAHCGGITAPRLSVENRRLREANETLIAIGNDKTILAETIEDLWRLKRGEEVAEDSSDLLKMISTEMKRLREFEAREAIVTNLMAAWVDVIDGKKTVDQFEELVKSSEAEMCRAIECLGRRDKIRKLEGAIESLKGFIGPGVQDYRHWTWQDVQQEVERYEQQLAEARAWK
jgi:DNA-directed RNA polymerase subunit RPC12/RpoP